MSRWLRTPYQPDGMMHVVPGDIIDGKAQIVGGHVTHEDCWCKPVPDEECPDDVLVHNDPERGGTNA